MIVTVLDVANLQRGLKNLVSQPLPAKISFKIAKLAGAVDQEVKLAEARRLKLIDKYGVEDATNPSTKSVPNENREVFQKEFDALLLEKITIGFDPIKIEDLGEIHITPIDASLLSSIFS